MTLFPTLAIASACLSTSAIVEGNGAARSLETQWWERIPPRFEPADLRLIRNQVVSAGDIDGDGRNDFLVLAIRGGYESQLFRADSDQEVAVLLLSGAKQSVLGRWQELSTLHALPCRIGKVEGDVQEADRFSMTCRQDDGLTEVLLIQVNPLSVTGVLRAPEPEEAFGHSTIGLPGAPGDGAGRVCVGSPITKTANGWSGRVFVFDAEDGSILEEISGPRAWTLFGYSLARGDDHDGDGWLDLIVGAPGMRSLDDDGGGSVRVLSGKTFETLFVVDPGIAVKHQGSTVECMSDLNGDGIGEILIGCEGMLVDDRDPDPPDKIDWHNQGTALACDGRTGRMVWCLDGDTYDGTEFKARALTDLDGDSIEEVMLCNPNGFPFNGPMGYASIHSGAGGKHLYEVYQDDLLPNGMLWHVSWDACALGDTDGDGVGDFVVLTNAMGVCVVSGRTGKAIVSYPEKYLWREWSR